MNIVYILDNFFPYIGGVENVFKNIVELMSKNPNNSITVITSKSGLNLPSTDYLNNVKIIRVCPNRYLFSFFSFPTIIKYSINADILHTTTYNAALATFLANLFLHKKTVIHVHEIFDNLWYKFLGLKGFFYRLFEKTILTIPFDHYICVSNSTSNILKKTTNIPASKISTIYSGIDYSIWDKKKYSQESINLVKNNLNLKNKYTCLFFGRPGISKGLESYLKAIPNIISKISNFHALLIISQDDQKRYLYIKSLISELKIDNHITIHPPVKYNQLPLFILSVNLVIVPSLSEGFGFCAAETSALKQNIVVSDTTSLPEAVSGQVNFFKPGDSDSITDAIIKSYSLQFQSIHSKKFFWSDAIKKIEKVYENCFSN